MAQAFDGELEPLHDSLERVVLPIFRGGSVDESPWPTEATGPARAPNFWQLNKPGSQVLADARTQAAQQPIDPAATPRPAPTVEQQNDRGR